jgi:hypothetical protein
MNRFLYLWATKKLGEIGDRFLNCYKYTLEYINHRHKKERDAISLFWREIEFGFLFVEQ